MFHEYFCTGALYVPAIDDRKNDKDDSDVQEGNSSWHVSWHLYSYVLNVTDFVISIF